MNRRLKALLLNLQAYRPKLLHYRSLLFEVPDSYDADDEIQINNYWYKAGDAQDAWEQLDAFRAKLRSLLNDELRLQMKLMDDGTNDCPFALLEQFERISQAYDNPPRFG